MTKCNLLPIENVKPNSKTFNKFYTRDFYKGKSLNYIGSWEKDFHYFNDEYVTHFVSYNGALLACLKSHIATKTNEPTLLYEDIAHPNKITGVVSDVWSFVLTGTEGETGKSGAIYTPQYDKNTGLLHWTLLDEETDVSDMYVKGDPGVAATVKIDSVETLLTDEDAEVLNLGDDTDVRLKFKLPRGKEGKRVMLFRDYQDDSIKWGYYGDPSSEWTVLCYLWDLSSGSPGRPAIHIGPEDPITYRENNKSDLEVQQTYKYAENMIWVDTNETTDFDHLNALYQGYKLAGGPLTFELFVKSFSTLGDFKKSEYYNKSDVNGLINNVTPVWKNLND